MECPHGVGTYELPVGERMAVSDVVRELLPVNLLALTGDGPGRIQRITDEGYRRWMIQFYRGKFLRGMNP